MTEGFVSADIAVAAAVNDHQVLATCLSSSPDISSGALPLKTYEGYATAGLAYNDALAQSASPILVLVHQDVYLPKGFLDRLIAALDGLQTLDPSWAVAGVVGMQEDGRGVGQTWSSGMARLVGRADGLPAKVQSLDEMLLVVRRDAAIAFDPDLPSFHLYGTDIVQIARAAGRSAYAIDLPVVHHSRPVTSLGGGYRRAYRYLQRKWRAVLPIANPIVPISRSAMPLLIRDFKFRLRNRGKTARRSAPGNPADIARELGFDVPPQV